MAGSFENLFGVKHGLFGKFGGYEKRKLYFNSINLLNDFALLKSIVNQVRNNAHKIQVTDVEIKPFRLEMGKSTPKNFTNLLNVDTSLVVKSQKFNKVQTGFYKIKINDLLSKTQFHFYRDALFLAKTEIAEVIPNSKIENFYHDLQFKYLGKIDNSSDYFIVRDMDDNLLFVENHIFNICMYYFSSDSSALDFILETIEMSQPLKSEKDLLSLI